MITRRTQARHLVIVGDVLQLHLALHLDRILEIAVQPVNQVLRAQQQRGASQRYNVATAPPLASMAATRARKPDSRTTFDDVKQPHPVRLLGCEEMEQVLCTWGTALRPHPLPSY